MNNFNNFTLYTPGSDISSELTGAGALFLRDEDGQDWYECQKLFAEDTYKIAYDSDNIVRSITTDVSTLFPLNLSVAETETLPEGCDISGRWKYDNGEVVDTLTVEEAAIRKTAEINGWRNMQEQGNVIFEAEGYRWDASLASQTRIEPVMTMVTSGTLPEGFFWTDADNEDIPATSELLTAIYEGMQQALVAQGFKIHERQRQMKQEVSELTTVAEIEAYEVGWGEDITTEE
ncbi:DUF4376 domain-containing protein [Escherichia sp. 20412-1]|uniref:DUF4376 domain-containing protein n=1 Tax=Escherichia sp. 20412-1 TaxID=2137853 RepID=UPI000D16237C|nr:DUF4376 domain-containing protein [Escherichia sp. 20412-1]PSY65669.1 phage tail protein [Escherichia sp. 20412-1]